MLGIECRWECPSCGNILRTQSPFWDTKMRKMIAEPTKCGCGRRGKFQLVTFKECNFLIEQEEEKKDE